MTIKWVDSGDDSGWEVWLGSGRRRLFVARKHGGKDAARLLAQQEEQAMKASQPTALARLKARALQLVKRGS